MGICSQIKDKRKQKNIIRINPNENILDNKSNAFNSNSNSNEQIEKETTDATLEDLQEIFKYLIDQKKFLEDKCGKKSNNQNNDNMEPKSRKDYQLMINKLSKEVFELEKINNIWENQDKNIQIRFYFEGQIFIINVDNETKLGDAFQNAIFNEKFKGERYTTIMNKETNFTDDYFKNNEIFNYKEMIFILGGENISEYFRENKPVSYLFNYSDSFISILVEIPLFTKVMLKESYNKFYSN